MVLAEQKVQASLNLADRAFVLEMAASRYRERTHAQAGAAHRGLKRADGAAYADSLDGRGGNDFLRVAGRRNHLASGDCDRYHNYDQHQHNHYVFSRFTGPLKGQHGLGPGNKVLKLHRFTWRLQELSLMLPRNRVVRVRRSPMSPSHRFRARAS